MLTRTLATAALALIVTTTVVHRSPPILPAALAADPSSAAAPQIFATPDLAVAALVAAARANDEAALRRVLGPGSEGLIDSGDDVADAESRRRFAAAYDAKHSLAPDARGQMVLAVGADDWPLPIPLVQSGAGWRFDSSQGAQDLVDRRIGRNELAAIRTMLAYVDAQKLYFEVMQQHGGSEYARRMLSTAGHHDGLYWPTAEGEPESPLAPLIEQAEEQGYPGEPAAGSPAPYQGYYFRILSAQGDDAPGGARNYVVDGKMTKGFALIAWPATYDVSGVMTFQVNQDGSIFQKDLGGQTGEIAQAVRVFDPDLTWARVDIVGRADAP
jgi:hypothetical protein